MAREAGSGVAVRLEIADGADGEFVGTESDQADGRVGGVSEGSTLLHAIDEPRHLSTACRWYPTARQREQRGAGGAKCCRVARFKT